MSKAVMISIQPKWCELIALGKKTVEIRKTAPKKVETPFKCYVYETRGFERVGNDNLNCVIGGKGRGMVVGEFVCDFFKWHGGSELIVKEDRERATHGSEVSRNELFDYLGIVPGTSMFDKKCEFYGWHISDLRIYDKPKNLSDFKRWNRTEENSPCAHTKALYEPCETCKECNLTRPPQSWCYVEELRGND